MDFAYRYRELLQGTLRFLPQDFKDKIQAVITEEDQYLEAQASSCAIKVPDHLMPKTYDLKALFHEVQQAGLMMQAMSLRNCKMDKTDDEQIAADLAYTEARVRLMRAETAYDQALRAVVDGASCA